MAHCLKCLFFFFKWWWALSSGQKIGIILSYVSDRAGPKSDVYPPNPSRGHCSKKENESHCPTYWNIDISYDGPCLQARWQAPQLHSGGVSPLPTTFWGEGLAAKWPCNGSEKRKRKEETFVPFPDLSTKSFFCTTTHSQKISPFSSFAAVIKFPPPFMGNWIGIIVS